MSIFDGLEGLVSKYDNQEDNSKSTAYNGFFEPYDAEHEQWFRDRLGRVTASNYDKIGFVEKKAEGKNKDSILSWIMQQNGGEELLQEKALEHGKPIHKLTMDVINDVYDNIKGTFELTGTAETYLLDKLNEIATGETEQFFSKATEFGTENEPLALEHYECWLKENFGDKYTFEATGKTFVKCTWNNILGGSPDGLCYNEINLVERVAEVKCPFNGTNHIKNLKTQAVDKRYFGQILGHFINTGAAYVDFISFNPRAPKSMQFQVVTINRNDVLLELKEMQDNLKLFLQFYLKEIKEFQSRFPDFIVPSFIQEHL